MGKCTYNDCLVLFNTVASYISSKIITPLYVVSRTLVSQVPLQFCPLNLQILIKQFDNNINVQFEPELFPALSLKIWPGCHVNIFSTGKIIVLGKNSTVHKDSIYTWIMNNLIL